MRARVIVGLVALAGACALGTAAIAGAGAEEEPTGKVAVEERPAPAEVALPIEAPAGDAAAKVQLGGGLTPASDAAAARYFTDTELIDQHGRPHRFYEDLIRGRKVLINFAFTSCKGVCPGITSNLARVQRLLGARVGTEISILTITVDPVNDTPAVLAPFAARFKASPGWLFLTGTPENVTTVLKQLGGLARRPEEHASTLLIGDARSGYWVKTVATARPEEIVHLVDHVDDEALERP